MGLDSVELVMELEDAFELRFPNEDAEKLVSVGDVVDYVMRRLAAEGRPRDRESVLAVVVLVTCEQCGTEPDKVTEATRFVEDLGID